MKRIIYVLRCFSIQFVFKLQSMSTYVNNYKFKMLIIYITDEFVLTLIMFLILSLMICQFALVLKYYKVLRNFNFINGLNNKRFQSYFVQY